MSSPKVDSIARVQTGRKMADSWDNHGLEALFLPIEPAPSPPQVLEEERAVEHTLGVVLDPKSPVKKSRADPLDPNPRKRPRNSYSDEDKLRIAEADARGGRKEYLAVAAALGMPAKTADKIVLKARYEGQEALHDKRRDGDLNAEKPSKKCSKTWSAEVLQALLDRDPCMSLKQICTYMNQEILRSILVEKRVPLSPEEQQRFSPLDLDKYLHSPDSIPEVRTAFQKRQIKSLSTISNYLDGLVVTRKITVPEKTTVNSESTKAKRLAYAQSLRTALRDDSYMFVFVDEMPFYLDIRRQFGRAKKGERAVAKVAASGEYAYKTVVAMAVSPAIGIVHADYFPPEARTAVNSPDSDSEENSAGAGKKKMEKAALRTTWSKQQFKEFMDGLLGALNDIRGELVGKKVVIVVDGAREHGPEQELGTLLHTLPNAKELIDYLSENRASIHLLKTPPNSPQLNLCEYYNRRLRILANELHHENYPHGEKMKGRLNVLEEIIKIGLSRMRSSQPQRESVLKLLEFFDQVIRDGGYLNSHC